MRDDLIIVPFDTGVFIKSLEIKDMQPLFNHMACSKHPRSFCTTLQLHRVEPMVDLVLFGHEPIFLRL